MFTGIIESLGTISRTHREGASIVLYIEPELRDFRVAIGGSVAIDGTCLTLESQSGSQMRFCAVAETLNRTTLSNSRSGRKVNLERAALIGSRLDAILFTDTSMVSEKSPPIGR